MRWGVHGLGARQIHLVRSDCVSGVNVRDVGAIHRTGTDLGARSVANRRTGSLPSSERENGVEACAGDTHFIAFPRQRIRNGRDIGRYRRAASTISCASMLWRRETASTGSMHAKRKHTSRYVVVDEPGLQAACSIHRIEASLHGTSVAQTSMQYSRPDAVGGISDTASAGDLVGERGIPERIRRRHGSPGIITDRNIAPDGNIRSHRKKIGSSRISVGAIWRFPVAAAGSWR
jgi:hypothetical protein